MKDKEYILDKNRWYDLIAHKSKIDISLPVEISPGIQLRLTNEFETKAFSEYLGFPDGTTLKVQDSYLCVTWIQSGKEDSVLSNRIRQAFVLLPQEIILRPKTLQLKKVEDTVKVGIQIGPYRDCGSGIYHSDSALIYSCSKLDVNALKRIKTLMSYPLEDDPFVELFESAHDSLPGSKFRFVTFMSLVEGLLGTSKDIGNVRENISTKMSFFYQHIWPELELAEGSSGNKYKDGRDIIDIRGVWSDLYKLRNLVAHGKGGRLEKGLLLKDAIERPSALGDMTYQDALKILDYGVKSLMYWNFEKPGARQSFSAIY